MNLLKRTILLSIFYLLIIACISKVNAASANISSNKATMTVGETANVTVSYTAAAWNIQVSGAVNYSDADASSNAKNTTKSTKLNFKPSKAGIYNISLSGDVTDGNTGSTTDIAKTIKITVKEKNNNENNSNNNNNNSTNTKVSDDATLKNLGITPNDFSGFRKAITSYNVSVPKSTEKISIYASPSDSKAQVSGTGSKSLQIGKNTFSVKVTAEDKKTTKTYTLNITRKAEDEISTDATLSNLGIRPKEYDFTGFKPNTTEYKVFVPNDVEKINIYAYPSSQKATVVGNGEKKLNLGANNFEIKVTAEDKKTTKIYNLAITRDEQEEVVDDEEKTEEKTDEKNKNSKIIGITDIKIANYTLEPQFDPEVYEYNVDITDEVTSVNVEAETSGNDIETEIVGNKDLRKGKNIITIIAHNKKEDEKKTYQIVAYLGNKQADLENFNNEINQVQKKLKMKFWIIRITVILIIVLIMVFLLKRYRLQREEFEEEDSDKYESETKKFYEQMENDNTYQEKGIEEEQKKSRKYKGKRFK